MCLGPEGQKHQIPSNWNYKTVGSHVCVLGIEPQASERAAVLLTTEPSLRAPFLTLYNINKKSVSNSHMILNKLA